MRPMRRRGSFLWSWAATALALCAALMVEAAACHPAQAMQMASGSYVGNGAANRIITGAGFRPDAVIIKGDTAQLAVMRTATMTGDATKELAASTGLQTNRISSLDADGFTLGAHAEVNGSGITYYWTSFKDDGGGDFRIGSYVGTGLDNRSISGVGFRPSYVIVMSAGADRAVQRSSAMLGDVGFPFANAGPKPNYIQALQGDGFQVGSDAEVNAGRTTYHYLAWKAVDGAMSVGSYSGDGADRRSIAGLGFRPDYLVIKAVVKETGVHRTASMAGDHALTFGAQANVANAIRGLEADGFQVGTAKSVNEPKTTYYWMAFRAAAAGPPAPALAITSVNGGGDPIAGTGFSVDIQSRDADGISRIVTTATGVRLSIKTGSGLLGGTLSGTIPAGASQVTIGGVTYTKAESGVVLTASRTSGDDLTPGDSAPLTVEPGAIAAYSVTLPSPQPAGSTFAVAATAQDRLGNRVTTDSSTLVTLHASSGLLLFDSNTDGIFGDNVKALNAGFVSMNAKGTAAETTTVMATDADGRTGSASLTITAGSASTLAFTTQPANAPAGSPIPGPPTVAVQDGFGNAITSSTASITVAIGANPGGGTLAGTTTKKATAGIASFGDLTISNPGSGYTLAASAPGLTGVTSAGFTITALTGALSGTITAASDGHPLSGALVAALQTGLVKGSVTTGADGTYSMGALAPGSYDVRASVAGYQSQTRTGITVTPGSTTTVNLSLAPVPGLAIRITSPAAGSVINRFTVLVRGEVSGPIGAEVGVTINGLVAEVGQGQFAAFVPLEPGSTTITATLVDPAGHAASDAITVQVASQQEDALRLLASPSGGLNPLAVRLEASSLSTGPIVRFDLDFEGDGVVDFTSPTPGTVSHSYGSEGLFFPTLTVTDDLGNRTTASTIVNVFPLPDLVAKWAAMKDALRNGDIGGALQSIAEQSRARYQGIFSALASQLHQVDAILTDIQLIAVRRNSAEFSMLRVDSDGVTRSYHVLFSRDGDGLWRLLTF